MLQVELRKKIFSRTFIISVLLLFLMFMLGSAGKMFGDYGEETFLSAIIAKIRGKWVKGSIVSYSFYHLERFWNANEYVPVLMPFISGLPGLALYMEEISGGNKRLILPRTTKRKYYMAKCGSSVIIAGMTALLSVVMFWIAIMICFDVPNPSDENFSTMYMLINGHYPENPISVSVSDFYIAYYNAIVSLLKFIIYVIKCSLFCQAVAVLVGDAYLTLGITVMSGYCQIRIYDYFYNKACEKILNGVQASGLYQVLSPTFLQFAGNNGYFEKKLPLALVIELLLCLLWVAVYVYVSEHHTDVSAG